MIDRLAQYIANAIGQWIRHDPIEALVTLAVIAVAIYVVAFYRLCQIRYSNKW